MQGFILEDSSVLTPKIFLTNPDNKSSLNYRFQSTSGHALIQDIGLAKITSLGIYLFMCTKALERQDYLRVSQILLDGGFDVTEEQANGSSKALCFVLIKSEEQLNHIFEKIKQAEQLPGEIIENITLACGYLPLASYIKARYIVSPEQALEYVNNSGEAERGLYILAYLAHHRVLPNSSPTAEAAHAGAGVVEPSVEINECFALKCYMKIPKGSPYYKQANFHAASILIAHLDEYEGLEKESALKQLMDSAYASGDIRLLGHAFTVCAGQDLSRVIEADSISDLLYKLAVRQRAPVSSSTVTPVAAAMIAGGAGAASSSEMPKP
ncbi:MAG: hypothetical protein K0Q57_1272 [Gammaproteobacteria bacterium]|jgi:hypothetical protein|nr:hypothetical protein [Gammaproteobacteria bacterium]